MLLLHLSDVDEASWAGKLRAALAPYPVVRRGDDFDPAAVRYIFVWKPRPDAFEGLSGLKAILSLGAGVDALLQHPRLPDAPIVRFVDADLSQRMSDYVVAHVTMHHRLYTRFRADQKARRWSQLYPPAASETTVGIMGMGVLGQDAARRLAPLGFTLRSWSRTEKQVDGVESFVGTEQFDAFLAGTDILSGVGNIDSGLAGCLEAAVIDDEMISLIKHIVRGYEVNTETLAFDVMRDIIPNEGMFLSEMHTVREMRKGAIWMSGLGLSVAAEGQANVVTRARSRVSELLRKHTVAPLSEDIQRHLDEIVAKASRELSAK